MFSGTTEFIEKNYKTMEEEFLTRLINADDDFDDSNFDDDAEEETETDAEGDGDDDMVEEEAE